MSDVLAVVILVFAAVWLGHACLWMFLVNITYGRPLHRSFLKAFRLFAGMLIFLGPPVFAIGVDYDWFRVARQSPESPGLLVPLVYAAVCLWISLLALPWVTIRRLTRPLPAAVISEQTQTVDIVSLLGHRPCGEGKYQHVAAWSFNEIFQVDYTTLTIRLPGLPQVWDGLSIVQLSDLHFIGTPSREYFIAAVDEAMKQGTPDLVAITGDLVDTDRHHRWILPVLSRLRWNIAAFAILGNHDWWYDCAKIRRRLRRLMMRVIGGTWERLAIRGEMMTVIGHEGPWFRPDPDLTECPADGFRLLLSHSPDNIQWARQNRIGLMLSGHNHGGQIRLPIFGSIFVPSQYSRRYDMGTFDESPTLLHVNRGLSGKEPLRIGCHPQVTRIILRAPPSV